MNLFGNVLCFGNVKEKKKFFFDSVLQFIREILIKKIRLVVNTKKKVPGQKSVQMR